MKASVSYIRRASSVLQNALGPVEIRLLLDQLETNFVFVDHHLKFLSECMDQEIVPKGLQIQKVVNLDYSISLLCQV